MKKTILLLLGISGILFSQTNTGIRSLNGSLNSSQKIVWDTTSTNPSFSITQSNGTHTIKIPYNRWTISSSTTNFSKQQIDTVGTVDAGVWQATSIDTAYTNAVSRLLAQYGITVSVFGKTSGVKVDTSVILTKNTTQVSSGNKYWTGTHRFDAGVAGFHINTVNYPNDLFYVAEDEGRVVVGDRNTDVNGTRITSWDANKQIILEAHDSISLYSNIHRWLNADGSIISYMDSTGKLNTRSLYTSSEDLDTTFNTENFIYTYRQNNTHLSGGSDWLRNAGFRASLLSGGKAYQLEGVYAVATNVSANTVTNAIGVMAEIQNLGAGSITNAYSFYGNNGAVTSGSITNYYQFYAEPNSTTGITNKYGFYQDGTQATNIFNGNTRFGGTTAPDSTVSITGGLNVSQGIKSSGITQLGGSTSTTSLLGIKNTNTNANITEWYNSRGTQLAYIDSTGGASFNDTVRVNKFILTNTTNDLFIRSALTAGVNRNFISISTTSNEISLTANGNSVKWNALNFTPQNGSVRDLGTYLLAWDTIYVDDATINATLKVGGTTSTTTSVGFKNALFANITEWYNSRGTQLARIDSSGAVTLGLRSDVNNIPLEIWTTPYTPTTSIAFRINRYIGSRIAQFDTTSLGNRLTIYDSQGNGTLSGSRSYVAILGADSSIGAYLDHTFGNLPNPVFAFRSVNVEVGRYERGGNLLWGTTSGTARLTLKNGTGSSNVSVLDMYNSRGTQIAKVDSSGAGTFKSKSTMDSLLINGKIIFSSNISSSVGVKPMQLFADTTEGTRLLYDAYLVRRSVDLTHNVLPDSIVIGTTRAVTDTIVMGANYPRAGKLVITRYHGSFNATAGTANYDITFRKGSINGTLLDSIRFTSTGAQTNVEFEIENTIMFRTSGASARVHSATTLQTANGDMKMNSTKSTFDTTTQNLIFVVVSISGTATSFEFETGYTTTKN
jgi:hypothetical protein